jgi:hypothetical protein
MKESPNNAVNSDVQKRRFALLLHAGYGERYVAWPGAILHTIQTEGASK